jgi:murein DD-endopeptidase MepM/ murein hydrolase activator NlpD
MSNSKNNRGLVAFLHAQEFAPATIIETDTNVIVLDLSSGSRLHGMAIAGLGVDELGRLIGAEMQGAATRFAFGRYGEPRELYNNENFAVAGAGEARTIHLGIDLFCAADTPVCTPLDGTIEVVANNDRELDYGPVVIVRHDVNTYGRFYTLYGHLSLDTLVRVSAGQRVRAGEQIAAVGAPPTNGNWPPHLHMQVITDLLDLGADFPGVAARSQQDYWFGVSPSPAAFFPQRKSSLLEYR